VQSIGGGVWSMAMLAIEHLGLEPNRDKLTVMIIGDSPILAQSLESGGIEATYFNYTHSRSLKDKGFPVLLDLGKAPIPCQGLAAATRRSYTRQHPQIMDSLMRGLVDIVAFIHKPPNKEVVVKTFMKNLRLATSRCNGFTISTSSRRFQESKTWRGCWQSAIPR
jgi:ABC-type nitrate/sulfonate/bicarbonate transport system substrate-binding protein